MIMIRALEKAIVVSNPIYSIPKASTNSKNNQEHPDKPKKYNRKEAKSIKNKITATMQIKTEAKHHPKPATITSTPADSNQVILSKYNSLLTMKHLQPQLEKKNFPKQAKRTKQEIPIYYPSLKKPFSTLIKKPNRILLLQQTMNC